MNNKLDFLTVNSIARLLKATDAAFAYDLAALINKFLEQDGIATRITTTGTLLDLKLEAAAVLRTFQPVSLA
jgi:hypothetical protein